jgi:protein-disulfide isomerase
MTLKPLLMLALLAATLAAPAGARKVPVPPDSAPLAEVRRFFTEDPDAPAHAPKGHDVTVVEYVDYQCPYCRSSYEALAKLMANDKKVKVLFRDWPVLGGDSAWAAMVATAAKYQGKYHAVHKALMYAPRPLNKARVEAAAKKAGADWPRLMADMKTHRQDITDLLERNEEQALMLGFTGTPGFIIGNFQSYGGITYEQLVKTVREARAKAKGQSSRVRKSRRK